MILRVCLQRIALSVQFFMVLITSFAWQNDSTLFKLLPASQTGVQFSNKLTESDTLNILNQANVYNGSGVGISDFNKDGQMDIYLSGNMVPNKLYLNKGSLKFQDVTAIAAVEGKGRWCTGVSVVDINTDGWPDIYVCASFRNDALRRTNLLYVNQGTDKNGVPVFKEMASQYGIADTGFSTQGVFFDYDLDGDLDLYVVTNQLNDPKTPIRFRPKLSDGTAWNTDRLYRNNGNQTFTNVSKEAGILIEGWGHAAGITDINLDGWPDIYVANDFVSNDLLYINNKNGTFTNRLGEYFKHTGWNAMGTDIVDINNDGLVDIISLEMLPEDNLRKKRMLGGNEYYNYFNSQKFGYEHQYVRNVLQLNAGMNPTGHPVFSEVGYLAGIYETDWSWCPLIADFDNDGFRDIIITNGLPRDVTDLDYVSFNNGQGGGKGNFTLKMVDSLPIVKLPNYSFKNTGGYQFTSSTKNWGLGRSSFSNGAAYADLDNDGDLDIVINNINETAFVYENRLNTSQKKSSDHYLSVALDGSAINPQGFGATVRIYHKNQQQLYEHQPCRGYMSTDDDRAHFGLGSATIVDSIRLRWPDGKTQLLNNVATNQTILIKYSDASGYANPYEQTIGKSPLSKIPGNAGINFRHTEKDAIDYNFQPSIPHKLSQYGPGIAVGDINADGFDDFYIGASVGKHGIFFMQDKNGNFTTDSTRLPIADNHPGEDMGAIFFDADNDGDLDLYVVSGSYELAPNQPSSQDILYFNNGKGEFEPRYSALPRMFTNGSCVRAADFDGDGDLDLFVGGRVVSASYPTAAQSYILVNYSGTFIDATAKLCAPLQNLGMITDALWSDFDNDGKVDLVLSGEWMPISFLKNNGTSFELLSNTGIEKHVGWWNSLVSGDFDNDGDIDYVAGNLGLNSNYKATEKEPMMLYAKDFDENGLMDPIVFCYMKADDGSRKLFPMTTRDDMVNQMISVRKRFPSYKSYGLASSDILLNTKMKEDALILAATDMQSSYIENIGAGHFNIMSLPIEAQSAPIYGMLSEDVDSDGNLDLIAVGNDFGMEPYSGRHDAFMGLCLKGDGKGNFSALSISKSGFFVSGDGKGLAKIHTAANRDIIIATQNQDSVVVHALSPGDNEKKTIALQPGDAYAEIIYQNKNKRKVDFSYGSTYLSQSSRIIEMDKSVEKIIVTDFKGNKREIKN